MKVRTQISYLMAMTISLALFGCGEDRKSTSKDSDDCEVGTSQYCVCDDGVQGTMSCVEGNEWSDCNCSEPLAGTGGSSGAPGGFNMDGGFTTEAVCGDGIRTFLVEECDGDQFSLIASSCEMLGLGSGELRCTDDCRLDTSMCTNDGTGVSYGDGPGQGGQGGSDDEEDAGI